MKLTRRGDVIAVAAETEEEDAAEAEAVTEGEIAVEDTEVMLVINALFQRILTTILRYNHLIQ